MRASGVTALVFTVVGALASAGQPREAPEAAAARLLACSLAEMMARDPAGPLRLEYTVILAGERQGSYRRVSTGARQWMETLELGTSRASRGVSNGQAWQLGDESLLEAWWLVDSLLSTPAQVQLKAGERVLAADRRKVRGSALLEVTLGAPGTGRRWVVLLDPDAGTLVGSVNSVMRREYVGWPWVGGNGRVASRARMLIRDRLVGELALQSASTAAVAATEVVVPAHASGWALCPGGEEPVAVTRVHPTYPERVRRNRSQGVVVMLARVQKDGTVGAVRVVRSPDTFENDGPILAAEAVRAVAQWTFEPPLCDGIPAEADTLLEVAFLLR